MVFFSICSECDDCVAQAVEDAHIDTKPLLQAALYYADRAFTIIFVFEMVIKMMAYGFKKYFTDAWCWLDFVIVVVRFHSPRRRRPASCCFFKHRPSPTLLRAYMLVGAFHFPRRRKITKPISCFLVSMCLMLWWLIFYEEELSRGRLLPFLTLFPHSVN